MPAPRRWHGFPAQAPTGPQREPRFAPRSTSSCPLRPWPYHDASPAPRDGLVHYGLDVVHIQHHVADALIWRWSGIAVSVDGLIDTTVSIARLIRAVVPIARRIGVKRLRIPLLPSIASPRIAVIRQPSPAARQSPGRRGYQDRWQAFAPTDPPGAARSSATPDHCPRRRKPYGSVRPTGRIREP